MKIVGRVPCSPLAALLPACDGEAAPAAAVLGPRAPPRRCELADFAFEPDCLSVDAGATIALENVGRRAPHLHGGRHGRRRRRWTRRASDEVGFDGVDAGLLRRSRARSTRRWTATLTVALSAQNPRRSSAFGSRCHSLTTFTRRSRKTLRPEHELHLLAGAGPDRPQRLTALADHDPLLRVALDDRATRGSW